MAPFCIQIAAAKEFPIKITQSSEAYFYFRGRISLQVEEFWAAALNADKDVVATQCLFRGTVDSCLFHPRDVFRFACIYNASSILVAHSHPSGYAEPSDEDLKVTSQLMAAARVMAIPIVDHIIVAAHEYFSFIEGKKRITDLVEPSC